MNQSKAKRIRRVRVSEIQEGEQRLSSEASHYLGTVLRLRIGDAVELFDGQGVSAEAKLTGFQNKIALIEVTAPTIHAQEERLLTLAIATPKGERADLAVEKLCELGVHRIVWLESERSVSIPREKGQKNQRRERIAETAANQSGRYFVPVITGPIPLATFLEQSFDRQFLGAFSEKLLSEEIHNLPKSCNLCVMIGPEGGFTPSEITQITHAGYLPRRLGAHILRVETAALASAALLMGAP